MVRTRCHKKDRNEGARRTEAKASLDGLPLHRRASRLSVEGENVAVRRRAPLGTGGNGLLLAAVAPTDTSVSVVLDFFV